MVVAGVVVSLGDLKGNQDYKLLGGSHGCIPGFFTTSVIAGEAGTPMGGREVAGLNPRRWSRKMWVWLSVCYARVRQATQLVVPEQGT